MKGLTKRQKEVLEIIKSHIWELGRPPTVREIADMINVSWHASWLHIEALRKKGYIEKQKNISRGIRVTGKYD